MCWGYALFNLHPVIFRMDRLLAADPSLSLTACSSTPGNQLHCPQGSLTLRKFHSNCKGPYKHGCHWSPNPPTGGLLQSQPLQATPTSLGRLHSGQDKPLNSRRPWYSHSGGEGKAPPWDSAKNLIGARHACNWPISKACDWRNWRPSTRRTVIGGTIPALTYLALIQLHKKALVLGHLAPEGPHWLLVSLSQQSRQDSSASTAASWGPHHQEGSWWGAERAEDRTQDKDCSPGTSARFYKFSSCQRQSWGSQRLKLGNWDSSCCEGPGSSWPKLRAATLAAGTCSPKSLALAGKEP
jgi:hypothetical protein